MKLKLHWQILIALILVVVGETLAIVVGDLMRSGWGLLCFLIFGGLVAPVLLGLKLHWRILIALVLAAIVGTLTAPAGGVFGEATGLKLVACYQFLGTLFLNALKMLIVPLIASAIITGMADIGTTRGFGRLGLKTIVYYMCSSLVAILVGLALVNTIRPGVVDGEPAKDRIGLTVDTADFADAIEGKGASDVADVFIRMIPSNVVGAAARTEMLGIITFSLLFGFFMTRLDPGRRQTQQNFWQGVFEVMIRITDLVMRFAPIGVFGLVAKTVALTGFDAFRPLLGFFFAVFGGLVFHAFVTLPLVLYLVGRVNPFQHFRAMQSALLMAFATSSSSATLPRTLECVMQNVGVSRRVTSFVLPLGATVNMDGTALYECVAAMFIAQCYGLEITFGVQFTVVVTALLTSIGVAGIPSASLVAIALILTAIGLPTEGIGLIMVVDRVLDMCRTSVNVWSDSCGAAIIARTEGETVLPRSGSDG